MKKIVVLLVAFIATVNIGMAQNNNIVTPEQAKVFEKPENPNGPKIAFEKTLVDYGTIDQGSDPYREFKFTNTGKEPLVIKKVKGSCGCTIGEKPEEPIMPGQSSAIKVRYDTTRPGPFLKTVTLTTNISSEKIKLTIKGKVNKVDDSSAPKKEDTAF